MPERYSEGQGFLGLPMDDPKIKGIIERHGIVEFSYSGNGRIEFKMDSKSKPEKGIHYNTSVSLLENGDYCFECDCSPFSPFNRKRGWEGDPFFIKKDPEKRCNHVERAKEAYDELMALCWESIRDVRFVDGFSGEEEFKVYEDIIDRNPRNWED